MNKRQRELLIGICEKVAVYALTAGLLGRFFSREVANSELTGLGVVSIVATWVAYRVAKGVR